MTMRTEIKLQCDCGHIGFIKMSENDQPYSKPWEKYSLKELNGNCEWYTKGAADFETAIVNLNPSCPKCGKKLNIENHLRT